MSGYRHHIDTTLKDAIRQLMEETAKEIETRAIHEIRHTVKNIVSDLDTRESEARSRIQVLERELEAAKRKLEQAAECTEKYVNQSKRRCLETAAEEQIELEFEADLSLEM